MTALGISVRSGGTEMPSLRLAPAAGREIGCGSNGREENDRTLILAAAYMPDVVLK
jgi:hypothetical protein